MMLKKLIDRIKKLFNRKGIYYVGGSQTLPPRWKARRKPRPWRD